MFVCLVACVVALASRTCGQCSFTASSVGKSFTYQFEPVVTNGGLLLHVTQEFKGGHEGTTELELPSDWAGQTHLEAQVTNLRAVSGDTVLPDTPRPNIKTLRFPPDHIVAISYDLVRDWQDVFENPKQFRAVLGPTFFEFTTPNALVHPKLNPVDMVNAHFDWQKLPIGWTVETSFGIDNRCQSFTGFWYQVEDALFAGGDFRLHQVTVHNQNVMVAIQGKWSFTDEEATSQIQKIITVEREFWRDFDFPLCFARIKSAFEMNNIQRGDVTL